MSLLPQVIDDVASKEPTRRYALVAEHYDSYEGSHDVSWEGLRRAINKTAAWVEKTVGPAKGFPTLAFMSTAYDFRYILFIFACMKTGHKIFLPSPRNSSEFHLHLLKKLDCHKIITSMPLGSWSEGMEIFEAPSLEHLLQTDNIPDYPYTKTYKEAKNDPVIVVHSSGSTGPPKPITWTHGYLAAAHKVAIRQGKDEDMWLKTFDPVVNKNGRMVAMPLFHTAALLLAPIQGVALKGAPMLMFPAKAILQPSSAIKFIETFKPDAAFLPPSVLEDISLDDDGMRKLGTLKSLGFGGAGIAKEAGERISKYAQLFGGIGTSEAAIYPQLLAEQEPYSWFKFEEVPGFDMQLQDDGLYELVFTREGNYDWPVFHVFPELEEYHTKDLYERHPKHPKEWKLISRKDDVLVLSNGEKVVPLPMEDMIRLAPEVHGVLYSGQGKFTVAAVIELDEAATRGRDSADIKRSLGPYIDRANNIAPAFAKLTLDMIVFTHPDLPMVRTAKGSFIRRATLANYKDEVEALYSSQEAQNAVTLVQGLSDAETVQALVGVFKDITGKTIDPAEDLFQSAGIDSMSVLSAIRVIRISVQKESKAKAKAKVSPSLVYEHPTINSLANALRSLITSGSANEENHSGHAMQSMLLKYDEGLAAAAPIKKRELGKYNVIVTGTTGSLGSYILHFLIQDPAVGKVFALNRADDGEKKQLASMQSRGLTTDFKNVVFMKSIFGNSKLGLSASDYTLLANETSMIIHNAWSVNFNQSLESFEPHVRGVRHFIDLAAASPLRPQIVFTSTIGVFNGWEAYYPGENRPETLVRDWRPTAGQGYGEGKYVSEHILGAAASRGISSTVVRVGQVAGPVERKEGQWNKQEWLPSIIQSSAYLGKLPSSLGSDGTPWIPADSMARMVVELGQKDLADTSDYSVSGVTTVYNLTNPYLGSWAKLVPAVRKNLGDRIKEVVSFADWFKALQASAEDPGNDATKNPGVKLLDFYEGLAAGGLSNDNDTSKAAKNSKTMAAITEVTPEWMDLWMQQWNI